MGRLAKQLTVAIIFLLLVGAVCYGFYSLVRVKPTCVDGIQNQKEDGVDCGTICNNLCEPQAQSPTVQSSRLLTIGPGEYDFVAKISNPNNLYGSGKVKYEVIFENGQGTLLKRETGDFFILPAQTRFLVLPGLRVDGQVEKARLVIKEAEWEKVDLGESNIKFSIRNDNFVQDDEKGGSEFQALVSNESDFDFDRVDMAIVFSDDSGQIVMVGTTAVYTLLSGTERFFKVQWPSTFSATNLSTQIDVLTNVFENSNFVRRYGSQQKFQEYYSEP